MSEEQRRRPRPNLALTILAAVMVVVGMVFVFLGQMSTGVVIAIAGIVVFLFGLQFHPGSRKSGDHDGSDDR